MGGKRSGRQTNLAKTLRQRKLSWVSDRIPLVATPGLPNLRSKPNHVSSGQEIPDVIPPPGTQSPRLIGRSPLKRTQAGPHLQIGHPFQRTSAVSQGDLFLGE